MHHGQINETSREENQNKTEREEKNFLYHFKIRKWKKRNNKMGGIHTGRK